MTGIVKRARPPSRSAPVDAPTGLPRLLAGWHEEHRPASLADHLRRYGPRPAASGGLGEALIGEVEAAGLSGRGGAGFPTHVKLRAVRSAGRRAVVVVNGMEGEPASAKDRFLLSVAPHLVLDGAVLAAAAVGADEVHVCTPRGGRSSLPALGRALAERAHGVDRVRISLWELPPRYVTGEETAVVNWLNGGPAKPTTTPPRPFERGVRGRPTLVQNVETLAHLALIARFGAAWFRRAGSADHPGSLLLSVSGAGPTPVVLEVAGATTIGRIVARCHVHEAPQALLVGGYFGSWLPWSVAATLPITHADVRGAGGALGAGILGLLPADACGLRETARLARYLAGQSARQCGPCELGLPDVADDLALICDGRDPDARARAQRRMSQIDGRGACRHPDGAVRLVRSALAVFADDVERHERCGDCRGGGAAPLLPTPVRSADEGWR